MKIYLDETGYKELLEKIENLEINKKRIENEIYKVTESTSFDVDKYNELKSLKSDIESRISLYDSKLKGAELITISNDDYDVVNIGDNITLKLHLDGVIEEYDYTICAGDNFRNSLDEVSINSPLGRSIYGKKIGSTVYYLCGKEKIKVEIVRKNKVKALKK